MCNSACSCSAQGRSPCWFWFSVIPNGRMEGGRRQTLTSMSLCSTPPPCTPGYEHHPAPPLDPCSSRVPPWGDFSWCINGQGHSIITNLLRTSSSHVSVAPVYFKFGILFFPPKHWNHLKYYNRHLFFIFEFFGVVNLHKICVNHINIHQWHWG